MQAFFKDGEDEDKFLERVFTALRSVIDGVPIKDRQHHFRTYERCFVSSEAISWLARFLITTDRPLMIQILEKLRSRGHIEHAMDRGKPFADENSFFRFTQKRRVVVVGGGFAGLTVVKKLPRRLYDVTLIDVRDRFVCTPSLPFCVCDNSHIRKITSVYTTFVPNPTTLVQSRVKTLNADSIECEDGTVHPFDFAVMATGSHYEIPPCLRSSDPLAPSVVNPMDTSDLLSSFDRLHNAKSVCVVGGGPTGLEIAGEIAATYPDKQVTIVCSRDALLDRLAPDAHKSAMKYFGGFANMKVLVGERVAGVGPKELFTESGTKIACEVVYCGVGFTPNTEMFPVEALDPKSRLVKVDPYLRVNGLYNVFALGDVAGVEEEKLAQAAEAHGALTVGNIVALDSQGVMMVYKPKSFYMIVSLGPKAAVCCKGDSVVIDGGITRKLKKLVEYKMMFDK